ncbi:glutathione S-transferase family protein [Rhizobium beringeri]|uniref:glutathione S-transferase family protein n=1 Tax=Rhizobium TaxID=379 RepID=UPI001441A423|nr:MULTISPECIES: glutathione S-transferase family protein [Rhizobium]NKL60786.1 glutathione S-transferase family protein [Rhizobium leguminosarum bv. viciae]WSH52576.1 glutathione S-transferase family protein [Rhizobium beringeri]
MTRALYSLCGADERRFFSPHCWKAVMALAHKGLDFEEIPTTYARIRAIGGGVSSIVPVLDDNGRLIPDSFDIALYLEEAYPEWPSLFNGEGGKALSRMVEGYSQMIIHPAIMRIALLDIHANLDEEDKAYFRESREARLGQPLEVVAAGSEAEKAAFGAKLEPLRHMLKFQPFIGGQTPLFADYIVFGALQWLRVSAGLAMLAAADPVMLWFERCLDLHQSRGRTVTAA